MKKFFFLLCIIIIMTTTYVAAVPDPNLIIKKGYENDDFMRNIDDPSNNIGIVVSQVTMLLGAAGMGIGTCVGLIYAVMWITATPAKKADLKERMLPLVLGVILLFGGPGIAATLISALTKILQ